MQRTSISIDESLGQTLDEVVRARGYASRSEAVRDLLREGLERWRAEGGESQYCVANLSYVVDRRIRSLPGRMAEIQHAHHDLVASTMTVRLDHYHSMETVILKGMTAQVRALAERVRCERGVKLGSVNMVEVTPADDHAHERDHSHGGHQHLSPMN